jgi:SAM-dependent methyltransferase
VSERWKEYLEKGIANAGGLVPFTLTQWTFLQPVFEVIRRALPSGGRILDVGCGAGAFSSLLAHHGYEVTGIDTDEEILALARKTADFLRANVRLEVASAFDLAKFHDQFDLVYSLGFVEHFDADVTVDLLRKQSQCASRVLVVIPTRYTRYAGPVTDERLYTRGQLCDLVRQASLRVSRSFVFGDVPNLAGRGLRHLVPPILGRSLARTFSIGMGTGCLGERNESGAQRRDGTEA